jgi:GIY-YIG catalytic domain-containing protein
VDPAEIIAALQILPLRPYDDLAARSATAPPPTHGLYAWWQSAGALPGVHGTPHPRDSGFELLYVGTAPKDAASRSNLRKRLGNHHRASIGSSTFRLDLTAFLWQVQGWRPGWTDRPKLPDDDIAALAEWQRKHLHVQWVEVSKPWDAEKAVVHAMHPPLNRDHNQHHPAYASVGDARDGLRRAARRNPL